MSAIVILPNDNFSDAREEDVRKARALICRRLRGRGDLVIWAGITLIAVILLERLRTPRTFFFDEWDFILDRRGGGLDSFLEPHNGHLSALPVLAYKICFALFGLDHYRPYRVAGLLVHAVVATLVFVYVKRRLGSVTALAAGGLVLLLGSGWQNILWPFQIGFMASLAAGIAAWMALDREDRRGDIFAAFSLFVAFSCSGLGIPIFLGTAARLLIQRSWSRMAWVLAAPGALYGVWYLSYGESQGSFDNAKLLPRFVVDAGGSSAGALFARDLLWGRLLLGVMIGFAMIFLTRRHSLAVSIVAPAVCVAANWALVGYSRAQFGDPGASRYVYVGAAFLILVLADLLTPFRGRTLSAAAIAVGVFGVWGNWSILHAAAGSLREQTEKTRSELRAVEWVATSVSPTYRPDEATMPQVSAGPYMEAVADLGSPAASDAEVAVAPNSTRLEVDRVSLEGLGVLPALVEIVDVPIDSEIVGDHSVIVAEGNSCTRVKIVSIDGLVTEVVPATGHSIVVSSTSSVTEVRMRRYADTYPETAFASVNAGESASILIPADGAPLTKWSIELRSLGDIVVCGR